MSYQKMTYKFLYIKINYKSDGNLDKKKKQNEIG